MAISTHTLHDTTYYVRGENPTLLILSGTHGDETEVTDCVTHYIDTHQEILPDYLYIPEVSPSAVKNKTRRNKYDHDINREFKSSTTDKEALTVMEICKKFQYTLGLAFHEDPDRTTSFYLYDSEVMSEEQLQLYKKCITKTGAKLFTGIDDPADPHLSSYVHDGYIPETIESTDENHGFSQPWLVRNGLATRVFNPEIPGKGSRELKMHLVEAMFDFSLAFI